MKNDLPIKIDLPEGFLEAETRCGHFVSKEMKEVWAVELDLLSELLRVCKKHNLKIFASDGTLLGAIRHKGFIPWDDDIDMMMFREDYEKLCEIAPKEFNDPYFFQTVDTDPELVLPFAKLRNSKTTAIQISSAKYNQGMGIDIFPLDSVVDDKELFKQQCKEAARYRSKMLRYGSLSTRYKRDATKGLKGTVKAMLYPFTNVLFRLLKLEQKNFREFERICKMYNHMNTEMVAIFAFGLDRSEHFKVRENFKEIIEVPFEFLSIPAGKMYERELTQRYGDWKKFVRGAACHNRAFLDARKSYTHYTKHGRE